MTELPIEALADDAAERLMRYARIDTQSDKHSTTFPSTEKQWDLLRLLRDELRGRSGSRTSTSTSTATSSRRCPRRSTHDVPAIGFLAHVDTTPDVSGTNVQAAAHPLRGRRDRAARRRAPGDPRRGLAGARPTTSATT